MNYEEIKKEIQDIFRDVFDDPELEIDDQTAAGNMPRWDSLNHVILISGIEKKYGIKFDLDDMLNTRTVSDICHAVIRLSGKR